MKKKLIVIFLCLNFLIFYIKLNEHKPTIDLKETNNLNPATDIRIIESINQHNNLIKNFVCENAVVCLWNGPKKITLKSKIYYQKTLDFKMEFFSILGKELEIGSNKDFFWYWSKRDKFPALYWSKHEDFNKTRLKTPFDPSFLKTTLFLDAIDLSNSWILQNENHFVVCYIKKNSSNQEIIYSVFVNKKNKNIDGLILKNIQEQVIAISEVKSRNDEGLPEKIVYHWREENHTMTITMNNPRINQPIGDLFNIPNYKPKINMAEE
jgi:hypothetical protein